MKKNLIYLSAAIAAMGMTMTGCIDNDEPESLVTLRNAAAEKINAEASYITAKNALVAAQAKQAENEALIKEYQALAQKYDAEAKQYQAQVKALELEVSTAKTAVEKAEYENKLEAVKKEKELIDTEFAQKTAEAQTALETAKGALATAQAEAQAAEENAKVTIAQAVAAANAGVENAKVSEIQVLDDKYTGSYLNFTDVESAYRAARRDYLFGFGGDGGTAQAVVNAQEALVAAIVNSDSATVLYNKEKAVADNEDQIEALNESLAMFDKAIAAVGDGSDAEKQLKAYKEERDGYTIALELNAEKQAKYAADQKPLIAEKENQITDLNTQIDGIEELRDAIADAHQDDLDAINTKEDSWGNTIVGNTFNLTYDESKLKDVISSIITVYPYQEWYYNESLGSWNTYDYYLYDAEDGKIIIRTDWVEKLTNYALADTMSSNTIFGSLFYSVKSKLSEYEGQRDGYKEYRDGIDKEANPDVWTAANANYTKYAGYYTATLAILTQIRDLAAPNYKVIKDYADEIDALNREYYQTGYNQVKTYNEQIAALNKEIGDLNDEITKLNNATDDELVKEQTTLTYKKNAVDAIISAYEGYMNTQAQVYTSENGEWSVYLVSDLEEGKKYIEDKIANVEIDLATAKAALAAFQAGTYDQNADIKAARLALDYAIEQNDKAKEKYEFYLSLYEKIVALVKAATTTNTAE